MIRTKKCFIQLCRITVLLFPIFLISFIIFLSQEKITIIQIMPEKAIAEIPFNSYNGEAALAVIGNNFTVDDVIYINNIAQRTSFGNSELLTCIVDRNLYQEPSKLEVKVIRKEGNKVLLKSNKVILEITN